jgi:cell wall-associated NlpC family hydrolase
VLRPIAWSALFSAVLATGLGAPAYADPVRLYSAPTNPAGVPDGGSRPAPTGGQLRLPGTGTPGGPAAATPVTTGANTLAAQVEAKRVEVALAGEQLLRVREEQLQAKTQVELANARLRTAQEAVTRAQQEADEAAAEALKEAAALPPGAFGSDLHGLGSLSRLQQQDEPPGQQAAARQLTVARDAQLAAESDYTAAVSREQALVTQYTSVEAARKRNEAALLQLQQQNPTELAAQERTREAEDQRVGAQYLANQSTAGQSADRRALAALKYALAQIGDRYVWAEEGPDQFDCSGLMYAAYRTYAAQPYPLPRVARDQYYATRQRQVDRRALLPGDLIFFSSSNSWTGVHHVGMYVGQGKMVHAPNANERVQVSTVWWSRFFAATRVFGAVTGPAAPTPTIPQPTRPAQPKPKPSPTPPPPKASEPATPKPDPSESTSTSAEPKPNPDPDPSVGTDPSTPPSTSPSASPSTPLTGSDAASEAPTG